MTGRKIEIPVNRGEAMTQQLNGWHLPAKDGYFSRFVEGAPRKQNGFNREHLELALKEVKAFDIAIDVGAHVGFWTLDLAERFGEVYAFEPAPDCYECLVLNMAGRKNVLCLNAAVGPHPGVVSIHEDEDRPGNTGARFVREDPAGVTPMIALDDLELKGCDLLKIDVEGFEPGVLRGANAIIRAYRPVIIMETDKRFAGRYGFGKGKAATDALELGYREVEYKERDPRRGRNGRMINAIRPDRIFVPEEWPIV
jgi:FkbM family methyltransferase